MRSGVRVVALLTVLFLAFSIMVSAQTATSSLRGTITDPKGAVVQGAAVTPQQSGNRICTNHHVG